MIKKITSLLKERSERFDLFFITLSVIIFSLLRLPSVSEPYWYGDEGIYEVIGSALAHGRILYSQIWDNKPPVLYLIYALFAGDQFAAKLLSLIAGAGAIVVFYFIAKKLFEKQSSVIISTLFFIALFGTPFLEGNIANAENFMALPMLCAFYLLFVSTQNINKTLNILLAGFLLSIAFLTKIVAFFDFASFSFLIFGIELFDIFSFKKIKLLITSREVIEALRKEIFLVVSFLIPIFITIVYFLTNGALSDFFRATFSQNVGYVGYGNFFLFPMGLLIIKLILLASVILISYAFRKQLGKEGLIILVWLSFSLFNAFFSERPYTHYLLVVLPALSLFLGYIIEKRKLVIITVPLAFVILFLINSNFKYYTKVLPYYSNYSSFIMGKKSVIEYQNFFDRNTPRDYEISRFVKINTKPSDDIFLWSDSGQIYALTGKLPPGRYIVAYHITFYKNAIEETKEAIAKKNPRYIIQTKDSSEVGDFLDNYELKYKLDNAAIYEKQF